MARPTIAGVATHPRAYDRDSRPPARGTDVAVTASDHSASLLHEAEQAIQVANVLRRIDRRLHADGWAWGRRFDDDGGTCLVGAIDEATRWTHLTVAPNVTCELALRLPRPLRLLAQIDARVALMIYNDAPGGQRRVRSLVARTLSELGGVPCGEDPTAGRTSSASPQVPDLPAPDGLDTPIER
jgi:hypothetical protein